MTVTTLPFMEAVEDSWRPGWVVIWCDLCWPDWKTFDGALHVCEDEAAEHLEDIHPRRYQTAHSRRLIHYRVLIAERNEYEHPQSLYCN